MQLDQYETLSVERDGPFGGGMGFLGYLAEVYIKCVAARSPSLA